MADWNATLYRQFEEERTRPARDLLNAVRTASPAAIVDLGCGPGNSTELLRRRFPEAHITGIDTSADMLASARARLPDCAFVEGDIAVWRPEAAADVIFANASLQWVPDHAGLLPQLLGLLAAGGTLAVQMPDNMEEPTHRLMREVAGDGPWAERLAHAARPPLMPAAAFYDLLSPLAESVDIWRTTYHHPMASPRAIVDWVRGTGLRPFLAPLDEAESEAFLGAYERGLGEAYPARGDGRRLLAFPRLFIVARKAG